MADIPATAMPAIVLRRLNPVPTPTGGALALPVAQSIMADVKTIAVMNQKGGVGKTTTTANLGAGIAMLGRAVCLLDIDPQCHLSLHFNVETADSPTTYDVLAEPMPVERVVRPLTDTLSLAPASVDLAGLETQLADVPGREQRLRQQLNAVPLPAEFVLIDCPPSLGLLTLNALAAADEVIIPLQAHFFALQGLGQLLQTISLVQERINPHLQVAGVVLCMFERITRLANEVVLDLQAFFEDARLHATPWSGARVFESVIRRNIKLAECPSHGLSIFDYDATCNGARDYADLAEEFLEMQAPVVAGRPAEQAEQDAPDEPTDSPAPPPRAKPPAAAPGPILEPLPQHVQPSPPANGSPSADEHAS